MKKIFTFVCCVCMAVASFAQGIVYDTNFALASNGATATASSGNAGAAIDGNNGSRWESDHQETAWWQLDMGQVRIFNTIQIRWEGAYSKTFELLGSNDAANWTVIQSVSRTLDNANNYEEEFVFATDQSYRYILLNATERGLPYGHSFFEFRVLYPGVSVLTTLELTAASPLAKMSEGVDLNVVAKDQNNAIMADYGTLTYNIDPAAAGNMVGNKYMPATKGTAVITAQVGEVVSNVVSVFAYAGENVALNKPVENIGTPETPGLIVNNGNEGDIWQGITSPSNATMDQECGFIIDLEAYYSLELVTIKFEGACSQNYTVDFSEDGSAWTTGYEHIGNPGINGRTDMIYPGGDKELQNYDKVRYVRFLSTKQATEWGCKIYEFKVFGEDWVPSDDAEAPVMGTASLVSVNDNHAVIAVTATDNGEVRDFHVVDAANGINVFCAAVAGNITVRNLQPGTTYHFTITARDLALNESANSQTVNVTTAAHLTQPETLPEAQSHPAEKVKAIYSDVYTVNPVWNDYNAPWGQSTTMEAIEVSGDNMLKYANLNWLGWTCATAVNASEMTHLHIDIWAEDNGHLGIVPIFGGTGLTTDDNKRKIVDLEGQAWNSFDLNLATDFAGLNLTSIFQFKYDNADGRTFVIDNVYFWTDGIVTALEEVTTEQNVTKVIRNGQLLIIKDGVAYNVAGQIIGK
ncbi:MAG: discoidin domain-containing protein [Paludibacteraceae bacterium]|nr:discoidin domain-containing protein [Paludibacteraceae bacterium]